MNQCKTCKYFGDFTTFNLGLRCLNSANVPAPGDFMILETADYHCKEYKLNNPRDRFEWDEGKNEKNKQKHGVGFEIAYDIYRDPVQMQMIERPEKWENLDETKFDEKGIEKNIGNLDPIRGKIIGEYNGKLYCFIYTFRNDFGNLTYRVISLRRASDAEEKQYKAFRLGG